MKSLHVPFGFFPDAVGGTEVYVAALARALIGQGDPAVIAAPGDDDREYTYDGLSVYRFNAGPKVRDVSAVYGNGEPAAARRFGRILDRERPDVFHMHAFTRACSLELVGEAQSRGIPVVFTYHTPTITCQRGTLLEFGERVCDGRIAVRRCAACTLQGLGVNRISGGLLAAIPPSIGYAIARTRHSGGAWTALRMTSLTDQRYQAVATLLSSVDRIVAPSLWVRELLELNGVVPDKICLSQHGVARAVTPSVNKSTRAARVRLVHLGRLHPVKGTALLIHALRLIPTAAIDLDIFGIVQGNEDAAVLQKLRRLAANDGRVRFLPPIEPSAVVQRLAEYDGVVVPSQWLETGPLVVLEAFAAGVPVVGSALGGLLDKIIDGINGLLVRPYNSVRAWAEILQRLADEPTLMTTLQRNITPPRTMTDVARDMASLYAEVRDERPGLPSESLAPVAFG